MEDSFWTKKQSCKLSKVDIKKWRSFFVFVCFNGRHFLNRKILENLARQIFFFFLKKLSVGCHRDNIQRLELAKFLNSFLFFQSTVCWLETAFRGSALYLRTRALLFSGAGWTRFLRGQTNVQFAKFRTVWGSNPGCGVRIELA